MTRESSFRVALSAWRVRVSSQPTQHSGAVLGGLGHGHQLLSKAKSHLHDISMAETRADAENDFDFFAQAHGAKYDKGAGFLIKGRDRLSSFYDFPAVHWRLQLQPSFGLACTR